MKVTITRSWFTLKPQTVKFNKSMGTFSFVGMGNLGGDLYSVKHSMITYAFVWHFLWWAVTFNMEETEGFGNAELYEKNKHIKIKDHHKPIVFS